MNPKVITIEPSASAALAARLLSRYNVGALPVCTPDRKLRGIVTDRDIVLRCVAPEEDPAQTPVRDIMSRSPATLAPSQDVHAAALAMAAHQVRRMPVVEIPSWWVSSPWAIWPRATAMTWRRPRH